MSIKNAFLAIMLIPLVIAGGFVITFLSYMFVPLILATVIGTFLYFFIEEGRYEPDEH